MHSGAIPCHNEAIRPAQLINNQTMTQSSNSLVQSLLKPAVTENMGLQATMLVVRVTVGLLMVHNGIDKLGDVQGFADNVVSFIGLPFPVFMTYCAAYVEIISSVLLAFGVLTRANAVALLGTMAVAIFFHLKGDGLHVTPLETASLYASIYLFFAVFGAGRLSVDAAIADKL